MERNGKTAYRFVRPLSDEERDRVLKEFARLQGKETQLRIDNEALSIVQELDATHRSQLDVKSV